MSLTLKEWRLAKEITQQEMAELLEVSVPTYKLMEDNTDKLTIGGAKRVAARLNVSIEEISFFA